MKIRRKPVHFSKEEKENLLQFLHEALPQTTRRIVDSFLDGLTARVDRSPEETEMLRFSILCSVARTGDMNISRGLVRSLEYQADEMELSDDFALAAELRALAHVLKECRGWK